MNTSVHSAPDASQTAGSFRYSRRAPNQGPRALPDVPPGEHYRPLNPRRGGEGLASFLGWFSIGLGLSQLIAPDSVARLIGVRPTDETNNGMRAIGLRELTSGLGILSGKRESDWLWSRVAGDAMDLALLARALRDDHNDGRRTTGALAAVAGVTLLDVLAAQQSGKRMGSLLHRNDRDSGRRPGAGGGENYERASRHPQRDAGSRELNTARGVTASIRGADGKARTKGVRFSTNVVTVNKGVEEVYDFWRNFENLPRFMRHLESVTVLGNGRSRWKAMAPAGATVEWEAETIEDRPNELISWRSLPGSDVQNAGTVRFSSAPGGRGTEVRVDMEYIPPAGKVGAAVAMLFHEEPGQQIHDDLRHFKQVMEIGEIVFSDASARKGMHPAQPSTKPVELKV
jgi:uncharacterized membrane protein